MKCNILNRRAARPAAPTRDTSNQGPATAAKPGFRRHRQLVAHACAARCRSRMSTCQVALHAETRPSSARCTSTLHVTGSRRRYITTPRRTHAITSVERSASHVRPSRGSPAPLLETPGAGPSRGRSSRREPAGDPCRRHRTGRQRTGLQRTGLQQPGCQHQSPMHRSCSTSSRLVWPRNVFQRGV